MALVHDYYPSSFKATIDFYSLVEKLFVFVVKRKLRCTLHLMKSLYVSFDTSKSHVEDTDNSFLEQFRILSALCPLGIQLSQVIDREDADDSESAYSRQQISLSDIELSFPLFSGCSPSQSSKRHKMLETTINEYLKVEYSKVQNGSLMKKKTFAAVKKDGWPDGFDPNSIPLPTPPRLMHELNTSTAPVSLYPPQNSTDTDTILFPPDSEQTLDSEYLSDGENGPDNSSNSNSKPVTILNEGPPGSRDAVSLTTLGGASKVLDQLREQDTYKGQIVHTATIAGRAARYGDLDMQCECPTISPTLLRLVSERIGVKRFYAHQSTAINHILRGQHVVVSTPTSSGKSVIYNLPVLSAVLSDPKTTALYLFPTKVTWQQPRLFD
jgi:DEAD/DEAH box helicase